MAEAATMSGYKDSLADLERHRLLLEDNVKQLRQALQHWQTWDAEYESLKEEVEGIPDEANEHDSLRQIHDSFEGELLVGKELDEIFGQHQRSKDSIINVLDRRIDYVSKNVRTLHSQVDAAENKYAAATVISELDATDQDGRPITDIVEELDDDGNVVSYRLNNPGDSLPHIKNALEKVGVDGMTPKTNGKLPETGFVEEIEPAAGSGAISSAKAAEKKPEPLAVAPPKKTAAPKKSVAFTPDTKANDEPTPVISRQAQRIDKIMKTAKEQEKLSAGEPVIPDNEDAEAADLRRQMLKYSMGEVGSVVAELQLQDDDDEDEGYDDEMWFDEEMDEDDDDDDDDNDEDKYGRYKGRVVTDSYKHRMLELEQQLGIKSRFTRDNTQQEDDDSDPNDEGIGRVVISGSPSKPGNGATAPAPTKSIVKDKSSDKSDDKKGVRFAQGLDVAPEPSPAPASAATPAQKSDVVEPLGDIVERTSTPKPAEAPAPAPRRQSRFKQARTTDFIPKGPFDVSPNFIPMQSESAPVPTGPPGTTLAKTLVEKESVSTPMDPQEVDDSMLDSEVADEHQRMRRRFIQREGGFLKEDDSPVQQLDETEGGRERMSRFKAARLSRQ